MTSVGRKVDHTINSTGGGPYFLGLMESSFTWLALFYHLRTTSPPVYTQLYITDSVSANVAHDYHMGNGNAWNSNLNGQTSSKLQDMLANHHPGVQHYKLAYELIRHMP
jgi:hypothetical protein